MLLLILLLNVEEDCFNYEQSPHISLLPFGLLTWSIHIRLNSVINIMLMLLESELILIMDKPCFPLNKTILISRYQFQWYSD